MKTCPNCGEQVADESIFCSKCGHRFFDQETQGPTENPAHELKQTPYTNTVSKSKQSAPVVQDTAIPRDSPEFKKGINRACIFSGIAFGCSLLAVGGSAMMRFLKAGDTSFYAGLVMMLIGIVGFIVFMFGFTIPIGKKLYGNSSKTKGFKETLPGLFMGFGFVAVLGALFIQGYFIFIY